MDKISSFEMERLRQDTDLTDIEKISRMNSLELERFIVMHERLIASHQREFDEHLESLASPRDKLVAMAALRLRVFQAVLHTTGNHRVLMHLNNPKHVLASATETASSLSERHADCALAA